MGKGGRKDPDGLADSCKCSSINWMAAGSRLFLVHHGFFLLSATFQRYSPKLNIFSWL